MADSPTWLEPSTIIGGSGLLAGLGAILKTIFDARRDSGKNRQDSEGEIREDLRAEIARQGQEILGLRRELAESRVEIRLVSDKANTEIAFWRERALSFQGELAEVRAELKSLHERYQLEHLGHEG